MTQRQPPKIFNRPLSRLRRARSAAAFGAHDFLHQRAMDDIVDRLETVTRKFPKAVFYGAGPLISRLTPSCGVENAISADLVCGRLERFEGKVDHRFSVSKRAIKILGHSTDLLQKQDALEPFQSSDKTGTVLEDRATGLIFDEELSPLAPQSLDLIVSLLTLHCANDLVGALAQARMALKPDGLLIAAIFGEETLSRLRTALYAAESEMTGGVSARIAPFASVQDFGQALSRAGFALPVVDVDKVTVRYEDPLKLLLDLRGMGETRALSNDAAPLSRKTLFKALEIFADAGGAERFDIVYLTGWAPHASQQQPLQPGAGKISFEEAVKKLRR